MSFTVIFGSERGNLNAIGRCGDKHKSFLKCPVSDPFEPVTISELTCLNTKDSGNADPCIKSRHRSMPGGGYRWQVLHKYRLFHLTQGIIITQSLEHHGSNPIART